MLLLLGSPSMCFLFQVKRRLELSLLVVIFQQPVNEQAEYFKGDLEALWIAFTIELKLE